VELLVVIAILALLSAIGWSVAGSVRERALQAECMNNMRQIGIALRLYADEHRRYPETTHTSDSPEQAWVALLEGYLDDYDEARICPADPKAAERLEAEGTSYVLNSFVFVPRTDPFGRPMGRPLNRPANLPDLSRTVLAFTCADRVGVRPGNDHTHSERWSSWSAVTHDISPDRHRGDRSNYLFADGRVESWLASDVRARIESGDNFARPPGTE